ncbi:uncharacterized protein LOC120345593 [Styela clava]
MLQCYHLHSSNCLNVNENLFYHICLCFLWPVIHSVILSTTLSNPMMLCILLVAGHGAKLEEDIKNDTTGKYSNLIGIPKALLPGVDGKLIMDYWWKVVNVRQIFSEVYLVTNADKYKHFERWATANDFPVENIVNDGSTTPDTKLGAVGDFELVLRNKNVDDDVMVVAGDMLFEDQNFDISQVVRYFHYKAGDLAIYYEMEQNEATTSRGIVEVDVTTNKILHFHEKPEPGVTNSRLASVVFYCLRKSTLATVSSYLQEYPGNGTRTFGKYMSWLINDKKYDVYGMKLPTRFQLIGQVSLTDYQARLDYFSDLKRQHARKRLITSRAYARIGLMGNPSDGFYGKTISLSISNFWADVTIMESEKLVLTPHPLNDPTTFGSLQDLHGISRKEGYLGGLRLLQATCKKFYEYCNDKGIALYKKNFTLSYDTNIPRQVGLAGSSAIVTATLKCLMQFYNLSETDLPKPVRASFILNVETDELFINAGLQDRVVQVYEGLMYMDFSKDLLEGRGYGNYERLPANDLPHIWVAYLSDPSDSGKIHSNVRQRYDAGDTEVCEAMQKFAEYTEKAKSAILESDWRKVAELMNANFDLRQQIYTESCLGEANLKMIQLGREYGSSTKFPGSGGAVIGMCFDLNKLSDVKQAMQSQGFVVCEVVPNLGNQAE